MPSCQRRPNLLYMFNCRRGCTMFFLLVLNLFGMKLLEGLRSDLPKIKENEKNVTSKNRFAETGRFENLSNPTLDDTDEAVSNSFAKYELTADSMNTTEAVQQHSGDQKIDRLYDADNLKEEYEDYPQDMTEQRSVFFNETINRLKDYFYKWTQPETYDNRMFMIYFGWYYFGFNAVITAIHVLLKMFLTSSVDFYNEINIWAMIYDWAIIIITSTTVRNSFKTIFLYFLQIAIAVFTTLLWKGYWPSLSVSAEELVMALPFRNYSLDGREFEEIQLFEYPRARQITRGRSRANSESGDVEEINQPDAVVDVGDVVPQTSIENDEGLKNQKNPSAVGESAEKLRNVSASSTLL